MVYSIDRIEGDVVVLVDDDGHSIPVSLSALPSSVACGDVLRMQDGVYVLDTDETQARRSYAFSLQEKLRRKKQS